MDEELLRCTGCGDPKSKNAFHLDPRPRGRSYRCAECRSDAYFAGRYKTVCAQCLKPRPLARNKVCRGCNAEAGLRECRGPCGMLLLVQLEFYDRRAVCRRCLRASRSTARAPGRPSASPPA